MGLKSHPGHSFLWKASLGCAILTVILVSPVGFGGTERVQAASGPDLTATKTDNVTNVTTINSPWTWTISVANAGDAGATIPDGSPILQDDLPSGPTYGSPLVGNVTGTNDSNISCAISANTLMCTANGADVTIDAGGGFDVSFTASSAATGTFDNPRSSGVCAVDPADPTNTVGDIDLGNNTCSDSVTVNAPDLTASKADDVSHTSSVGGQWTWTTTIANSGSAPATFATGDVILTDNLPTSGLTYGSPAVSNPTGVTGSGTIACSISSNTLTCSASGGSVILGAGGGKFDAAFTATANAPGTYDNPRSGGICKADPGSNVAEADENNNTCADSVTVNGPDLTALKSDSAGGTSPMGTPWTWRIAVANGGAASATFADGQTILTDDLPATGLTYGAPSVGSLTGVTGAGTIACDITSNTLTCSASGGDVTLAASTGTFTVSFQTTPSAPGPYANPRSGGVCTVDPGTLIAETDETNNTCADSVTVTAPDLTALKSDSAGGTVALGSSWTWRIAVANGGAASATFADGQTILTDDLPATGLTYGAPTVGSLTGVTGSANISCSIAANTLTCSASGGPVTLAASTGAFTVSFLTTPSAAGPYANPRSGGVCAVDPATNVAETNEGNNSCSETVTVTAPDLTAVKSNNVSGTANTGSPWSWRIQVANAGNSTASFTSGQTVLLDNLPSTGLTYGPVTVSPAVPNLTCAIATNNLTCTAGAGGVTIAAGASFTVSFNATASAGGVYANPRTPGVCAVDPNGNITENIESNNACADSVSVNAPDLTAVKSNNVGGTVNIPTPWTWSIQVSNGGAAPAAFTNGQVVLRDNLPNSGLTYGAVTVSPAVAGMTCTISGSSNLTCTAGSAGVSIAAGASFRVSFTATPTNGGTFNNPRSGGGNVCAVDPDGRVSETSETNNACSDNVTVNAPDLTVTKTDNVSNLSSVNAPWTWTLAVANSGQLPATFSSGQTVILDQLPTGGMTYGPVTVTGTVSNVNCAIASNVLTCTAGGGGATIAVGATLNVAFSATSSGLNLVFNPRLLGTCAVDPNNNVREVSDSNNSCSDIVLVLNAPDLTAQKTDTVGGTTTLGSPTWTWNVVVRNNLGGVQAVFPNGSTILTDNLPAGLTYGAPTVNGVVNITNSGNISCAIAANTLTCTANGAAVTFGALFGQFNVAIPVTASAIGTYANPRSGGICAVDPNNSVSESNDNDNSCSDTVTVTAPDLTAVKTDTVSGATTLGNNWQWKIVVANSGTSGGIFTSGQVIFRDQLPTTGLTYSGVGISAVSGVTNSGNINCAVASNTLTCTASGATVTIGAGGTFTVSVTAAPTAIGVYNNPRSGGVCAVDPDSHSTETNEGNNACSDSVTVTAPDLTATKGDDVTGGTTLGNSWTWTIHVANTGNAPALFVDGKTLLHDNLPAAGLAYGPASISNVTDITNDGNIICAIAANVLTCTASGADVTLADTTGAFDVSFTVTPSVIGSYANPPTGGTCAVDPGNVATESNEANNACHDTVVVTAPDLKATKTDDVSNATTLGNAWTWQIAVANSGNGPAIFTDGKTVLTDNLPAGPAYSTVTVSPAIPNLTCAITSDTLTCQADGGTVVLAPGALINVTFTATPSVIGEYDNPPTGGTCAVDPDQLSVESNENNNTCQDNVTVTAPDLTAVKTDTVGGSTTLGNNWQWKILVSNGGNSPALFTSGQVVLHDDLPASGLAYGAVTVAPAVANMTCGITGSTLTCSAGAAGVSIAAGRSFTVTFTATPSVIQTYDNPTSGGVCLADPNHVSTESDETNNACSDTVIVTAPDLTAVKTDSVSGATTLGNSWTWTIHVANAGNSPALFASGEHVFTDNLPTSGLVYTNLVVTNPVANVTCAIAANTLDCKAGAGGASFADGTSFDLTFTATPSVIGVYDNPTATGVCAADPLDVAVESDETNNACSDTVTVTAPDLTAVKSDSVTGATTLGNNWTWTIHVANAGNSPALFASGEHVFTDNLPTSGLVYTNLVVTNPVANVTCAIAANTLDCKAGAGGASFAAGAAFDITFTATPSVIGVYDNPTAAGVCAADPLDVAVESNENNNACSDTVTVTAPDLTAVKSDSVSHATTLGNSWTWTVHVANAGNSPALFASGEHVFTDNLPTSGLVYTNLVVTNPVANVTCAIAANTLDCTAGAAGASFADGASFDLTFTATPSVIGVYANPAAAGVCAADPLDVAVESNENNNACQDTVTVTAPDLTATKTDSVSHNDLLGSSWTWTIHVANAGNSPALFASGEHVFTDNLPTSGLTYTNLVVTNPVANVTCAIAANTLDCKAGAGGASFAAGAAFDITFTATPSVIGVYDNPTATGVCAADPLDVAVESNEGNNTCQDTVTVTAPDLTTLKTDSVSGATTLGNSWTWTIHVENVGNAPAVFSSGQSALRDNLPTTGLTYSPVTVTPPVANMTCSITAGILSCVAGAAGVSIASGAAFDITFTATPTVIGVYDNPTAAGICAADPDGHQVEISETNNACSDSVTVTAPELSAVKTDDTGNATTLGNNWTWTIAIANTGNAPAPFADGQTIFSDALPATGLLYGPVTVSGVANMTNDANMVCQITGTTLTCTASGAAVTLGAGTGAFKLSFTATPATIGVFANPPAAGGCLVDPSHLLTEPNEANNLCSDTVTVTAPDLTATKTNNVSNATTLGNSWTWSIVVANVGNSPAPFANGDTIFTDTLPAGPTYGAVTVGSISNVTNSANVSCAIAANTLTCKANNAAVTMGATTGAFTVSFSATPAAIGVYVNPPAGGTCLADPNNVNVESSETNNTCSNTVTVTAPDLTATKTDSVGGAVHLGTPWTWKIVVANTGNAPAVFSAGQVILRDQLPAATITYGPVTISGVTNVTNSGNISCAIAASVLTCVANGGSVTLGAGTGAFTASFTATPSAVGVYANPTPGGVCAADPDGNQVESNEGNNACSDNVGVDSPDLQAVKTDSVSNATALGNNWTWNIAIRNIGSAAAVFTSGQTVLTDSLPTTLTYSAVTVNPALANLSCGITANVLTCTASGGTVTIGTGTTTNVSFTATPSVIGVYANPRAAGTCAIDPNNNAIESNENNNTCSDTVTVTAPDLTATKTNNVVNATTLGNNWSWTIALANGGNGPAVFTSGQVVLRDNLPTTGLTYSAVTVTPATANLACAVAANVLTCTATGGTVSLAAGTTVNVAVVVTPTVIGAYTNPPTGGTCAADPDGHSTETNEGNNTCSNTVTVTAPDLTAAKTNNVGGATTLGNNWTWRIAVANTGNAPAAYTNGQVILRDDLPAAGLTYGAVAVANIVNVTNSNLISCAVVANTLTCTASGGTVTIGSATGAFAVTILTTPTATGTYANPRAAGTCAVDPNGLQAESNEGNNACSNTVTVTAPDLTAVKTNNVGGAAILGSSWTWSIVEANGGTAPAVFANGQVILRDELPTTGLTYGAVTVGGVTNVTNSANISCAIAANVLSCTASGAAGVSVGAGTGTFTVSFTATPSAVGTYVNPRAAGVCAADPNGNIVEINEANNACSNTVTVTAPDLTVVKTNDVSNTITLGHSWSWTLTVANGGTATATFASGQTVLTDNLPATGLTYGAVTVTPAVANLACSITANTLTCAASGGSVTLAAGSSFAVSFSATPSATGTYANPRSGGVCSVDTGGVVAESNENNNTCSNTVTVTVPDLTAVKTDDVNGVATQGVPWTWSIALANSGTGPAQFSSGQVVLTDNLPATGLTYGAVTVNPAVPNLTCAIAATTLTCSAGAGGVTLAAGSSFTVSFTATASTLATYTNPTSGGVCAVDPNGLVTENNKANNACSDSVQVKGVLNVSGAGNGSGTMVAKGAISCAWNGTANSGDCSELAASGTVFAITATPDPGVTFLGWTGCDSTSGTNNSVCNITLTTGATVTAEFVIPDLTATKTNSVGGSATLGGTWTWTISAANPGGAPATFASGKVILRDQLPATGLTYGTPTVGNIVNVTNGARISCAIASATLTCTAKGGSVVMGSQTGSFDVSFTAKSTVGGLYTNPRSGGVCAIDPSQVVPESDEGNNTCSDSVTVNSPDLTATKTDNVAGSTTLGNNWTWSIAVANSGNAAATFAAGQTILTDTLPAGPTYGAPVVGALTGITNAGNISCAITKNVLTCTASGGSVTLADGGGTFSVSFTATPTTMATYQNPPSGKVCSVDPGKGVAESNETNNACSDTVTVGATLTVSGAGTGTGSITGGAISCSWNAGNTGICSMVVQKGGSVTLTAAPGPNSIFTGWTDCPKASGLTCTVSKMTTNVSVTANFIAAHTLTVSGTGAGHGSISDGGTISCQWDGTANSGTCSAVLPDAQAVTLTAAPLGGSTFVGWTGCPSAAGPVCTIASLNSDLSITAEFEPSICGLLLNCSFEDPSGAGGMPSAWVGQHMTAGDGIAVNTPPDGQQSFGFAGNGKNKDIYQDVAYAGLAKSHYRLTFWTKSDSTTKAGLYRIVVTLYQGKTGVGTFYINVPYGTYDWQQFVLTFTAKRNFNRVRVMLQIGKTGSAWFDDLLLTGQ